MAKSTSKKRGLGRGLSALMADVQDDKTEADKSPQQPDRMIPIEKIAPNPDQPRRHFDEDALADLAASIAEKGIIQPLILRENPQGDATYEIVAGERRWRASQRAKLHEVPAIIREFSDTEVLEVAIIENIQRADLNPLEEAQAFSQLMEKFGHTQDVLSKSLGKSRSHIANSVRLLTLPDQVQEFVKDGKLSAGHARALITSDDPVALAKVAIKKGLSVRDVEKMAKSFSAETVSKPSKSPGPSSADKDADTKALEQDLSANLGMKVTVDHSLGQENGKLVVSYKTLEDLDTLCRLLSANR
ncbi:MAG: ParB/RepB/Spo0J family partition protein [Pseudomonadota bacterium]